MGEARLPARIECGLRESTARKGHRSDGRSDDLFKSEPSDTKFLVEFSGGTVREELVGESMSSNVLAGGMQFTEVAGLHEPGLPGCPAGGYEEASRDFVLEENGKSFCQIGKMTVVEGDLRPEALAKPECLEESDLLLKERRLRDIGVGRWRRSELVIEKEEAAQS